MKKWQNRISILAIIILFVYFIWPTPYLKYTYNGMTVLSSRFTGCQRVITPAGHRSIGGDARCFLIGEDKIPSVINVYADKSLTTNAKADIIVDDILASQGIYDLSNQRQLNIINNLKINITLESPSPIIKIYNYSKCDIWGLTLHIRPQNQSTGGDYKIDTGVLKSGDSFEDYISIRRFATEPEITAKSVLFHDSTGAALNSPCAI